MRTVRTDANISAIGSVVVAMLAPPLRASDPVWLYCDPVPHVSFSMFSDWETIAPASDSRDVVVRFRDPATAGDEVPTEIALVRTGVGAHAAWDASCGFLGVAIETPEPPATRIESFVTGWGVNGTRWSFPLFEPGRIVSFASVAKNDVAYALCMSAAPTRNRADAFEQIARSFHFPDDEVPLPWAGEVFEGMEVSTARRARIERSLIKNWKLIVSPRRQYIVVYNDKSGRNEQLARVVGERIERLREQVFEKMFPRVAPIHDVPVVRICADRKEFVAYGGSPSSAGYWNADAEELVLYDASPRNAIDDDTLAALQSLAFTEYVARTLNGVQAQPWFTLGHANYFAGAKYNGGKFKIEPFDWRVAQAKRSIEAGPRAPHVADSYLPLREFVRMTRAEYYASPSVSFAQGWSFVWFLREVVPRNAAYAGKWGSILETYFTTLRDEVAARGLAGDERPKEVEAALNAALGAAFRGVDFDELESAWVDAVRGM